MTTFFKKHSNIALNLLAVLFLVVIIGCVAWAVDTFTTEASVAFSVPKPSSLSATSFNLKDAATLDLRGLNNSH